MRKISKKFLFEYLGNIYDIEIMYFGCKRIYAQNPMMRYHIGVGDDFFISQTTQIIRLSSRKNFTPFML